MFPPPPRSPQAQYMDARSSPYFPPPLQNFGCRWQVRGRSSWRRAGDMYSPPYSARATPLRGSPLHSGLADPTGLSQLW